MLHAPIANWCRTRVRQGATVIVPRHSRLVNFNRRAFEHIGCLLATLFSRRFVAPGLNSRRVCDGRVLSCPRVPTLDGLLRTAIKCLKITLGEKGSSVSQPRNHQGSAKYVQSSKRNGGLPPLWPNLCVLSMGYEFRFTRCYVGIN